MQPSATAQALVSNCEKEPVHIPGKIQAHGFLIALDEKSSKVIAASENSIDYIGHSAESLIGQLFSDFIADAEVDSFKTILLSSDVSAENPLKFSLETSSGFKKFDCLISRYRGPTILEFEPSDNQSDADFKVFYRLSTRSVEKLRSATSLIALSQSIVDEIRALTNFDRVVVYQFDPAWNGHVIAESKSSAAHTYLDLHFPASDIPKQVLDLYSKNPLRMIPTVDYQPSPIISVELDSDKLDLTMASLRNVSPVHVEYLKNMEVMASMSVAITNNGKLWGLVSCSHESGANYVSYDKRAVCTFLAATMSSLLPFLENQEDSVLRNKLFQIQNSLVMRMTESAKFVDGLFSDHDLLLGLTGAHGAAAFLDGSWRIAGKTPKLEMLEKIRNLITEQNAGEVFYTNSLKDLMPVNSELAATASGVLGFSISKSRTNYILWFRPELVQTVKWGGNPNKPVEIEKGEYILHPRKSFELWKETVQKTSEAWKREEIDAAKNLRISISDIVLQRVELVTKLNTELERSNVELDSFAYAASHDLKEPLRGISNYAAMIDLDAGNSMTEKSKERLKTILRLTQRAEGLISSLLDYSQVGRTDLVLEILPLTEIVQTAIDSVSSIIEKSGARVIVNDLPFVNADKVQLTEVFTNLIVNGIKYNTDASKEIIVGSAPSGKPEDFNQIFVKDNGIGIEATFHKSVFKIFKRLHSKSEFGGGTGTGLTIAKKIVERHGGSIEIESEVGKGTTFLILLPKVKRLESP